MGHRLGVDVGHPGDELPEKVPRLLLREAALAADAVKQLAAWWPRGTQSESYAYRSWQGQLRRCTHRRRTP